MEPKKEYWLQSDPQQTGRFHLDEQTMLLHDYEGEIEPFAAERLDEVARTLFERALDRLAKVLGRFGT